MRITALVENQSEGELKPKHGLSLHIETSKHNILFDLGPDGTLFENAKIRQIDLTRIDTVIISHGHGDHGGALEEFIEVNKTAKIYIQRKAFEKHYAKLLFFKVNIGINPNLVNNPQIVLIDGDYQIDDELALFTVKDTSKCYSKANDTLYTEHAKDDFSHEQNLMIYDNTNTLIMGCGHAGIINILEKATKYQPKVCFGGYHLYNPLNKKTVSDTALDEIAQEMAKYDIMFYTYHCTGQKAYQYLSKHLNIHYLSCGQMIEI